MRRILEVSVGPVTLARAVRPPAAVSGGLTTAAVEENVSVRVKGFTTIRCPTQLRATAAEKTSCADIDRSVRLNAEKTGHVQGEPREVADGMSHDAPSANGQRSDLVQWTELSVLDEGHAAADGRRVGRNVETSKTGDGERSGPHVRGI